MAKIIVIKDDIVRIGMDDKSVKDVPLSDLTFKPVVGQEVDVFETDKDIIICPAKEQKMNGVNIQINHKGFLQYYGKPVNKLVYIILALCFGSFGVHKFYAGKIGQGFLYLLFAWTFIPSILAFIEAIRTCFKVSDEYGNIII